MIVSDGLPDYGSVPTYMSEAEDTTEKLNLGSQFDVAIADLALAARVAIGNSWSSFPS